MKPQNEPIEAVMWRTMKILRVFDAWDLQYAIVQTHPITRNRLTRYINKLAQNSYIYPCPHCTAVYQISPTAPAQAPIFRKRIR